MIASLRGKLLRKDTSALTIEVGGVGYEVSVPLTTFPELPEEGKELFLFIQSVTKEDGTQLFGFASHKERDVFNILRTAKGVGAKTAISLLSSLSADDVVSYITSDDINTMVKVPGIGRKTAERIVFELKEKLLKYLETAPVAPEKRADMDAELALISLGYTPKEAREALSRATPPEGRHTIENVIREALKYLVRGRR